jgi:hypothetical protein
MDELFVIFSYAILACIFLVIFLICSSYIYYSMKSKDEVKRNNITRERISRTIYKTPKPLTPLPVNKPYVAPVRRPRPDIRWK